MKWLRNLVCWATRHRLTEVRRPFDADHPHKPVYGRNCRCGKRWTTILIDGSEQDVSV